MTKDTDISDSLKKSKKLSAWVADRLDGLKIPDLPNNRRIQLAMACHHLVIEHGQAIILLVDNELYGSALALQRPMFEAIVRGVWLRYSATNKEVDKTAAGRFLTLEEMARNSLRLNDKKDTPPLKDIKEIWWNRLCGYTHGGLEQIRSRLDNTGLQANYCSAEAMAALRWSDMAQLYSGVEVADAACNESLAREFLNCMRNFEEPSGI